MLKTTYQKLKHSIHIKNFMWLRKRFLSFFLTPKLFYLRMEVIFWDQISGLQKVIFEKKCENFLLSTLVVIQKSDKSHWRTQKYTHIDFVKIFFKYRQVESHLLRCLKSILNYTVLLHLTCITYSILLASTQGWAFATSVEIS